VRRQALKLIGVGTAAIFAWGLSEALAKTLEDEGATRRFTGSRESGSFSGMDYPVTSGADQGKIKLNPDTWTLRLTGSASLARPGRVKPLVLSYADLLSLSTTQVIATLDCTGGWYSTQAWQGVRLVDLLEQAEVQGEAIGILLKGVLDYSAHFTLAQAQEILLATRVGGMVLDHQHGYPLRAVVPSRRGWHWVKWLTEIEVLSL
jgi:DMSO/TMAO reductase YedYZ molybdopterin-dependent catalytic subunit